MYVITWPLHLKRGNSGFGGQQKWDGRRGQRVKTPQNVQVHDH